MNEALSVDDVKQRAEDVVAELSLTGHATDVLTREVDRFRSMGPLHQALSAAAPAAFGIGVTILMAWHLWELF
jgi:hypothetical protein